MTRWTSSSNQTAAAAQSVVMVTFADLQIPGSPSNRIRAHDGVGTITWGGNDWSGVGQYGSIDVINESFDLIASPVTLTLSGVDSSLITDSMNEQYHGQTASIYIGLFSTTTNALIDTPELVWEGFMDHMVIEAAEGSATIKLVCEHRLRRMPAASRYTDEDQRATYAGDVFFNQLHTIPGYRGKWGARDVGIQGRGGGWHFDPSTREDLK